MKYSGLVVSSSVFIVVEVPYDGCNSRAQIFASFANLELLQNYFSENFDTMVLSCQTARICETSSTKLKKKTAIRKIFRPTK